MPRRNLTGELTRYLDKRARLSTVPTETSVIRSTGSTGGGTWVTPAMVPIASTANPQNVGSSAAPGSSSGYARGDHVHQGIHSLAVSGSTNLFGDVTLSASGGATLAQSTANVITLTAPAASTAIPAAVSDTGVVGTSTAWAPGDHAHALNIGTGLAFSSSTLAVQLANNAYLPALTSTGATRNLVGISTADAALIGSTALPSRLQGTSLDEVPGIATNLLPDSTTPTRDIGSAANRWRDVYGVGGDLSSDLVINGTLFALGAGPHGYEDEIRLLQAGSGRTRFILTSTNDDTALDVFTGTVWVTGIKIERASGNVTIAKNLDHDGTNVGFYGTAPSTKQTVTGSRGGNAALASLLTALAAIGLITDNTTT